MNILQQNTFIANINKAFHIRNIHKKKRSSLEDRFLYYVVV